MSYNLNNLPKGTFKLTIKPQALLGSDFPKDLEIEYDYLNPMEDSDLAEWLSLQTADDFDVEEGDNPDAFYDIDPANKEVWTEVNPEFIEEARQLGTWNVEEATQVKYANKIEGGIEDYISESFSDAFYEYPVMDENGHYFYPSGRAVGIKSVSIEHDDNGDSVLEITANYDLVQLVNDAIAGVGQFEVVQEDNEWESEEELVEYIKSHIGWLKRRAEVYGESSFSIDNVSVEDQFDTQKFIKDCKELKEDYIKRGAYFV